MTALLELSALNVELATAEGFRRIVHRANLELGEGESLGVVGESGSGKTMTALAIMGLLPDGARVSGSLRLEGRELLGLDEEAMRALRGDRIAMVFQEPMTALNPLIRVGVQVGEPLVLHREMSRAAAYAEAVKLLGQVGLSDPDRAVRAYPFGLSGGERQRAVIAMAIGCSPRLLIADEPTTALDVTVQARILDLLDDLRARQRLALIMVSHDLAVIAGRCDRVMVMYAGFIMEEGPVDAVLGASGNPYTRALLEARPQPGALRGARLRTIPQASAGGGSEMGGCPFAGRCDMTLDRCRTTPPPVVNLGAGHTSRCHRANEMRARA